MINVFLSVTISRQVLITLIEQCSSTSARAQKSDIHLSMFLVQTETLFIMILMLTINSVNILEHMLSVLPFPTIPKHCTPIWIAFYLTFSNTQERIEMFEEPFLALIFGYLLCIFFSQWLMFKYTVLVKKKNLKM